MGDLFSKLFAPRPDALTIGPEISRGANGVVFRGRLGAKPVAIKKIHGLLLDYARDTREEQATVLADFRREGHEGGAGNRFGRLPSRVRANGGGPARERGSVPRRVQPGRQRAVSDGAHAADVGAVPPRQQRGTPTRETGYHLPADSVGSPISS